MQYLIFSGDEIGYVRKCVLCMWIVYMLNKDEEIVVVIKKKIWSWIDKYDIEEQWKVNLISYRVEYSWSGLGFIKEVYFIMNFDGDEIVCIDCFRLDFGKMIKLKDFKMDLILGIIERLVFQLYFIWDIIVNNKNVVLIYLFGVIVIVIILREVEDND